MALNNLPRVTQPIFTGQAPTTQLAVFGTMKSGSPIYSNNIATLMGSSAYGQGFTDAILDDKAPYLEETNALLYAITTQLAYLFQKGVPEWDGGTTYYTNSFCQYDGILYQSTIDGNLNLIPPNNPSQWQIVNTGGGGGSGMGAIGQPIMSLDNTLQDYEIWLEGAEVSRSTYSALFAIYGVTYGNGDGLTTFNLPDWRNRSIWGTSQFGYVSAGLPNITGTFGTDGTLSGSFYRPGGSQGGAPGGTSGTDSIVGFDASRSNPIYGAKQTVVPPSIGVRFKTRYK